MGALCCCFLVPDVEEQGENALQTTVHHRNCTCFRCLNQRLENIYNICFRRGRVHASQATASLASASLVEGSSISNTYRAPPRPLPYDDPRFSGLQQQRDGLRSRADKASSHLHEESESVRRSYTVDNVETAGMKGKLNESDYGSKLCHTESSLSPSKEVKHGISYIFPSSEDEDDCPTCLEEYTSENPRIILKCSHHFHLSCIYEWMERSEACPVCGKVMLFNETT